MKEKDLVAWHAKEYRKAHPHAFYYKIQDTLGIGGKKPFDVIIDNKGKHYAIEFKLHKKHTAFSLAKIEKHQIDNLLRAQANGRIATVYIGIRFLMDVETQERLQFKLRRIKLDLVYPIDEIVEMIASGQKSIPVLPLLKKAINGEP